MVFLLCFSGSLLSSKPNGFLSYALELGVRHSTKESLAIPVERHIEYLIFELVCQIVSKMQHFLLFIKYTFFIRSHFISNLILDSLKSKKLLELERKS